MADAMISASRQGKKSGVGGIGSKSNNFKESKNANIRRNAKFDRIDQKAEYAQRQKLQEREDRRYAPVDKHDLRKIRKNQEKEDAASKKLQKSEERRKDAQMD